MTPNTNRIRTGASIVAMSGAGLPRYRLGGKVFRGVPTAHFEPFRAAEFYGKGNYLGVVLELENTSGAALEGDETLLADGQVVRAGIGTPEYFNGSYNWLAPNGSPAFSRKYAHGVVTITNNDFVCYRYHMSDAVPFDDSLTLDFEVGAWGQLNGNYRSFALAYLQPEPCSVRDQDSSHSSVGGEILTIFCRGLANNRSLRRVTWNGIDLDYVSGLSLVMDSVLSIRMRAPFAQPGVAPLIAEFEDGSLTLDPAWEHRAAPVITFRVLNEDPDGFAFAGDSLEVDLRGYPEDESATVSFMGRELAWSGNAPEANANGVIHGRVLLPSAPIDMPEGFGPLTAQARMTEGIPEAVSDEQLGAFRLERLEIEDLSIVQTNGGTADEVCATDYQEPEDLDTWGRMLVRKMTADTAGESVTFAFQVRSQGNYRLSYFFGKSNASGNIRVDIDDMLEIDTFRVFDPGIQPLGNWARTDTIRGNWHFFAPGVHTVTFAASPATILQHTFDMILDQILFESEFHQGFPVAAEPRPEIPKLATLAPPYPNPFNATTRLKFSLNQSSDVKLDIFNLLGQRVTTLIDQRLEAGEYVREFSCPDCASGLYLARMSLPNTTITQKLLLLK